MMSKNCNIKIDDNKVIIQIDGLDSININCSNDIDVNPIVLELSKLMDLEEDIIIEKEECKDEKQKIIQELLVSIIDAYNASLKMELPIDDNENSRESNFASPTVAGGA